MGRGSGHKEQREMASGQRDFYNEWLRQQQAERTAARGRLTPEAQKLISDPGYSPEEQSAMLTSSLGATGTVFDVARDRARRRLAKTRNTAGYGSLVSELARGEARAKSTGVRDLKTRFADEKQRRKMAGLGLLGSLYGIDTNLLQSTAGLPVSALGAHAQGIDTREPWWKKALGAGAGVASAFI